MKKLLTLAACAFAATAFGQGYITLLDSQFTVSVNNGTSTANMSKTANSYYFTALEWTGAGTPVISSISSLESASWYSTLCMGTNGTSVASSGRITAPNPYVLAGSDPWSTSGTTANYVIVGWSATEGNNWATILNSITTGNWADTTATGAFGWSIVANLASGGGPLGTALCSAAGVNVGFVLANANVQPIPEPTTIALAGLGGLSLLLFRRRK